MLLVYLVRRRQYSRVPMYLDIYLLYDPDGRDRIAKMATSGGPGPKPLENNKQSVADANEYALIS